MSDEQTVEQWVDDYRKRREAYVVFTDRLTGLLSVLLPDAGIDGEITSRTKEIDSFRLKLERRGEPYADPLMEMPDLVGLRVTTYYVADLERVGGLLAANFAIDRDRSYVASYEDPGRFGYASNHYVVRLSPTRAVLPEWRGFAGMCAEVQVRTVLQHAWASISHKLAYKHEEEVPAHLRRKLFRLSALLEAADEDFTELQQGVAAALVESSERVIAGDLEIGLDLESLRAFFDVTQRHMNYARSAVASGFEESSFGDSSAISDENLSSLLAAFRYAEFASIDAVDQTSPADTAWAEPHFRQLTAVAQRRSLEFTAYPPHVPELLVISLSRSRPDIHDFVEGTGYSGEYNLVLHDLVDEPPPA